MKAEQRYIKVMQLIKKVELPLSTIIDLAKIPWDNSHDMHIKYVRKSDVIELLRELNGMGSDNDSILDRTEDIESEPFENDKPIGSQGLDDMNI